MDESSLLSYINENEIPVSIIPEERKYWLVRTQAGEFYDEFFHENFIGIGWNELNNIDEFLKTDKNEMLRKIEDLYTSYDEEDKSPQPGRIYSPIYRFLFELNINDIVMIPSINSTYIAFGIIQSDAYIHEISETDLDLGMCDFNKRRSVKWLKTVKRDRLDPYLYRMMQAHQTISNATEYANNIDRTLHSFYVKGNKAHLVVRVEQENDIPAVDLINFVNSVLDLAPQIENPEHSDDLYTKNQIDLKISVQSIGVVEFISSVPYIILGIGVILIGVTGGKMTFKHKETEIEMESDGLIEKKLKVTKHKDAHLLKLAKQEHEIYKEKLKLKIPEEENENEVDQ